MNKTKFFLSLGLCALLAACQTTTPLPSGAPRTVKLGKPYSVDGNMYYPKYDPHYSEEGIASWYGPGFHGKKTANGETYDQHAFTAAHKTLPMPSIVRVTNLKTGKSISVRITDRGPFKSGRIIDLSKGAAQALNIQGLEKVRVEYQKEDTEKLWASMNIPPTDIAFARNDRAKPSASEIERASDQYDSQYAEVDIDESQISSAAPIMSVSSANITNVHQSESSKSSGFGLIRSAEAATAPQNSPFGPPSAPLNEPPAGGDQDHQVIARIIEDEHESTAAFEASQPKPGIAPRALDPPIPKTQTGYMVQAGAFSSSANANTIANKIRHFGSVMVDHLPRGKTSLYRVRLGPFASKSEAEQRLHDLFKIGIKDARVFFAQ